jgi:hypothetical protein
MPAAHRVRHKPETILLKSKTAKRRTPKERAACQDEAGKKLQAMVENRTATAAKGSCAKPI